MSKRKKKTTTKKSVTRIVVTNRKKRKSKKRSMKGRTNNLVKQYAELISNPCHGPLLRSVGLGQITERVRETVAGLGTSGDVNGYVVWFPSFHNPGVTAEYSANFFHFENSNSATAPLNTATNPLGMIALNTTGLSRIDPAAPLLGATSAFSRAKAMSACLQLEYIGALNNISGQIAVVTNMPFRAFYGESAADTYVMAPPSVDGIFAYAADRKRLQVTGHEAIWRPSDTTSVYRTTGNQQAVAASAGLRSDAPWKSGTPTSTSSTTVSVNPDDIYGICIAWKGVNNTTSSLSINAVKVVELELAPSGYAIEPTFSSDTPSASWFNPVAKATSWLDTWYPSWQSHAVNGTLHVAGALADSYAPSWGIGTALSGARGRMSYRNPQIDDMGGTSSTEVVPYAPLPGGW